MQPLTWLALRQLTHARVLQSALRAALNSLRDARPRTPRVLFIQGGVDDASPLEALLLDDGGGGEGALATFQAHVSTAAQEMLTQGE